MDYAGWDLAAGMFDGTMAGCGSRTLESKRRASPPVLDEIGLGEPYRGDHRWWLAGLAGVACTLFFLILLLTIASRQSREVGLQPIAISPGVPAAGSAASPSAASKSGDGEPQLTLVSPERVEVPDDDERAR
jgi:hypothetical protein